MESKTGHRKLRFTVPHKVYSAYTDHSQDPIEDVRSFFFGPSPSPIARPVIDATTERAVETDSPNVVREIEGKKSYDQSKGEEFHLLARGCRAPFPWLLYCLLEDSTTNGTEEIVSWADHGRSFHVHDRKAFETRIMPR